MIDVTSQYKIIIGQAYTGVLSQPPIGRKVNLTTDPNYRYVMVPKARNLFAEVRKMTSTSNWPQGLIAYCDDDDIMVATDAIGYTDNTNQTFADRYTRFELKFPAGATKVYVTSGGQKYPPIILKKIM